MSYNSYQSSCQRGNTISYFATFWGLVRKIIFLCSVDSYRIAIATKSGFITLEDLKRQAEEIGLEGKEKTRFLTQEWKMVQENEVRKLKLAAEAEERKLVAEEWKLAAETEERKIKLAAEDEERKLAAKTEERKLKLAAEAEEEKLAAEAAEREANRKHKLEMEKLRLESERLNDKEALHCKTNRRHQAKLLRTRLQELKPQCFLVLWTERIIWIATCFALKDMPLLQAGNDLTGLLV